MTPARALIQTCWRGMVLGHPAEWEMVSASRLGEPGRCVFADRRHERLKVQWRTLAYVPNLAKTLEEKKNDAERDLTILRGQPPGWRGTVDTLDSGGTVVHAGCFFDDLMLLAETVLLWPKRRDQALENAMLSGIRPVREGEPEQGVWRAMGIGLEIDPAYDLLTFKAEAGRTTWGFGLRKQKKPTLTVRRIATPQYWLHTPLEEWLETQRDVGWRARVSKRTLVNGHTAARAVSVGKSRIRDRLGNRVPVRAEVAWHCPEENRVYHVRYETVTDEHDLFIPEHLVVHCCAPYHPPATGPNGRRRGRATSGRDKGKTLTTEDLLAAVPLPNQAAKIVRGSRGGALAEVPMRRPWYLSGPVRWVLPLSDVRRVKLDAAGVKMLDLCDGTRTVERIVEEFAAQHRLSFAEAQKPAMHYMRNLAQRGILAVAGLGESEKQS